MMSAPLATVAVLSLWIAMHRVPWLGGWLADTARAVFGTAAVGRAEVLAYGLDDRWNVWRHHGDAPVAHWSIPTAPEPLIREGEDPTSPVPPDLSVFLPRDVGPLFPEVAAKGDGVWVPVADFAGRDRSVVLYKTLIHPDRERPFAELFVMAVDLHRTRLHAVAGSVEPEASTEEGRRYTRTGLIPDAPRDALVAAFNGGFKAEHGQYGMKVDEVTLLPPRDHGCTIAGTNDGQVLIATWTTMVPRADETAWWRQTPACMVEDGKLHPGLASDRARSWGTALEGGTVVRRSAVGLDEGGNTLYVGVSNGTNARAMARGMQHAGASSVAQLDINWSYPHIVTFRASKSGGPEGYLLFDGFAFEEGIYLSRRSQRDFFYLTREPSAP